MKGNPFTDPVSIRTIDTYRIFSGAVAVLAFLITEAGRFIYRPFIYKHHIDDLGLADSIGNLGGIIVQIFFMLAVFNSQDRKAFNVILFLVVGYILYEFLQPYLPKGVFDWKDVYGTLAGGMIAAVILYFRPKIIRNNRVYHRF